jgi:serine/threonine protein kinase
MSEFDTLSDTETAVSQYCFLIGHKEGPAYYVDIYVPETLGTQMQLVPGSSAHVQGLVREIKQPAGSEPPIYIRARTGEAPKATPGSPMPFTATLRFPNKPQMLRRFLRSAAKRGVKLEALRTFGYRGDHLSDVVIEGSIPAPEPSFVERHNLRTILSDIVTSREVTNAGGTNAEVTNAEVTTRVAPAKVTTAETLKFSSPIVGTVMYSLYYLDLPLFSGRYLKIRVNCKGRAEPFKDTPPALRPARVHLDFTTLTLTIEPFSGLRQYLLVFSGDNLTNQPPITKTILENLPENVNVDALSAYEYVEFDPHRPDSPAKTPPSGKVEMFCTSRDEIDVLKVQESLETAVAGILGAKAKEMSFATLRSKLKAAQDNARSGDKPGYEWSVFRKRLQNGRFAYVEHLGDGGFGSVNKYFNLETREVVAGKHLPYDKVTQEEINGFRKASGRHESVHIVRLLGSFFDDDNTVLIMEYLDLTLAAHRDYRSRPVGAAPHNRPGDIGEFVEMAVHLCKALESRHGKVEDGKILVHGDIKPENIGATLVGGEVCWKLLDFGLASWMPAGARQVSGSRIAGTPPYMSPQLLRGENSPLNDIYALGIVFYQTLAGWNHPSTAPKAGQVYGLEIPIEVEAYMGFLESVAEREPEGFEIDANQWTPQFREGLDDAALQELADIVRKMVEMGLDARYQSAQEVRSDLERWRWTQLRGASGSGSGVRSITEGEAKEHTDGEDMSIGKTKVKATTKTTTRTRTKTKTK